MKMLRVDACDEKKCVHASSLETGLMHGAERQELVEYSCAVKPPFRDAGYRRSRDGVPQIV